MNIQNNLANIHLYNFLTKSYILIYLSSHPMLESVKRQKKIPGMYEVSGLTLLWFFPPSVTNWRHRSDAYRSSKKCLCLHRDTGGCGRQQHWLNGWLCAHTDRCHLKVILCKALKFTLDDYHLCRLTGYFTGSRFTCFFNLHILSLENTNSLVAVPRSREPNRGTEHFCIKREFRTCNFEKKKIWNLANLNILT